MEMIDNKRFDLVPAVGDQNLRQAIVVELAPVDAVPLHEDDANVTAEPHQKPWSAQTECPRSFEHDTTVERQGSAP